MPHLFTSRLRKHFFLSFKSSDMQIKSEKWNNRLYLISSLLFVIGSIFFLPSFSIYSTLGAKIFSLGIFLSLIPCLHDFHEVITHHSKENLGIWNYLEILIVSFYLIGTINYLIGNYYFIFKPTDEFSAGVFFIIGSVLFTIAAITNLMLATCEYSCHKLMLMNAAATSNIIGGLLFIVGSIPYLWKTFSLNLDNLMAFQFIFGSLAFLIGSIFAQIYAKTKINDFKIAKNKI